MNANRFITRSMCMTRTTAISLLLLPDRRKRGIFFSDEKEKPEWFDEAVAMKERVSQANGESVAAGTKGARIKRP